MSANIAFRARLALADAGLQMRLGSGTFVKETEAMARGIVRTLTAAKRVKQAASAGIGPGCAFCPASQSFETNVNAVRVWLRSSPARLVNISFFRVDV